jgi:hypothetical protein
MYTIEQIKNNTSNFYATWETLSNKNGKCVSSYDIVSQFDMLNLCNWVAHKTYNFTKDYNHAYENASVWSESTKDDILKQFFSVDTEADVI